MCDPQKALPGALPSPSRPSNAFSAAFVPAPRQAEARDAKRRAEGGCNARPRPLRPAPKLGLPSGAPFWTLESPKYPRRSPFRVVSAPLHPFNTFSEGPVPVFLPRHPRLPPFLLHPALPVLNGLRTKGTLFSVKNLVSRPIQPDFAVKHIVCDTFSAIAPNWLLYLEVAAASRPPNGL